jgi:orotidine-5'-phosphate decarboxylase
LKRNNEVNKMAEENQRNTIYVDKLIKSAQETGSIVCMGLDPVMEAMPSTLHRNVNLGIVTFYEKIFDRMLRENVLPGAFKPNQGFFEKYDNPKTVDFQGSETLSDVILLIKERFPTIPIILDYKRGDIATSSTNYAQVGVNWGVDALTVAPYMGTDSVMPFVKTELGVYVLDRTSNPGGVDFQNLRTIKKPEEFSSGLCDLIYENIASGDVKSGHLLNQNILAYLEQEAPFLYEAVAHKILDWSQEYTGVGAVFGATVPNELMHMAPFFAKHNMPLLIPGVGGQGGSLEQVLHTLNNANYPLYLARINSSSGITHPWKTSDKAPSDWDIVVVQNLDKLNKEINYKAA